jgi:hypothetical protein
MNFPDRVRSLFADNLETDVGMLEARVYGSESVSDAMYLDSGRALSRRLPGGAYPPR